MRNFFILFFILSTYLASSQTIEGMVKDAEGNPLPFATILVKGTPIGVTANNENKGSYSRLGITFITFTSSPSSKKTTEKFIIVIL